jgi:hypothetical protein
MCEYVTNSPIDPYNRPLNKFEVQQWIWDHMIFGPDGQIVGIHDGGQLLVLEDGWQPHVEWYSRVKMAEARKKAYSG